MQHAYAPEDSDFTYTDLLIFWSTMCAKSIAIK